MNGRTQRVSTGTGQTVMGDILYYYPEGRRENRRIKSYNNYNK